MKINKALITINSFFKTPLLSVLLIFFTISLLNIPILATLWRHGFDDGTYSHAFLIPFIVLYLFYQLYSSNKLHLRTNVSETSVLFVVFSAFLLFVFTNAQISLGYWMAMVLLFMACLFVLFKFNWYILFTAAYLVFLLPMWGSLTSILQTVSVFSVEVIMGYTGIPTFVEAPYVSIPAGTFEIADGCSGLRYLIVSLAISTLFSFLYIKNRKKALLFIFIAILGALLTNWIRITLLILIGHWTDMTHSLMNDHNSFGWYIYAPFMIGLFWFGNKISDHDLTNSAEFKTSNETVLKSGVLIVLFAITFSSTTMRALTSPATDMNISLEQPYPIVKFYNDVIIHKNTPEKKHLEFRYSFAELDSKPTYFENKFIPDGWGVMSKQSTNKEMVFIVKSGSKIGTVTYYFQQGQFITSNMKEFKVHRIKNLVDNASRVSLHWKFILKNKII
jgi:exosortase A|tara:strand:- start:2505 stop:3845 length:1341 start_codon:yes stop_codon:yes gene_type:complete